MRVGFLNNQIDNRGTGNALFDYAHYNEEILGNESVILTMSLTNNRDEGMAQRLFNRFGAIYDISSLLTGTTQVDFLYHIKYGNDDGVRLSGVQYGVHAVFDGSQPHGDRYATISSWMGEKYNIPWVPHIVKLAEPDQDLRKKYDIPKDAIVFGRHGGMDTFDIPWVWDAINAAMILNDNIYFMFLNTEIPNANFTRPDRLIFIGNTSNQHFKSSFIHACDSMLHARNRGETFGIACGEFAIAGKPVLTYGGSGEKAHLRYLGSQGKHYNNKVELLHLLLEDWRRWNFGGFNRSIYDEFTPEHVMAKFKEVFLDEGS